MNSYTSIPAIQPIQQNCPAGTNCSEGYNQYPAYNQYPTYNQITPFTPSTATTAAPSYVAGTQTQLQSTIPSTIAPSTLTPAPMPVSLPVYDNMPETLTQSIYIPGFLRTKIGSLMRVEFLIGNNITDRVGILTDVGASFIVLRALDGGSSMVCDLFSIKFVTLLESSTERALLGAF
ncbi:hypothetical protein U6B65_01315 [Oscillospiraceae bacterium MB08-C2-2]|nr:hypothetical protein U6B65_01315 [Oscillospiraceae bacterium MB08-C2-2]